jgi:hypothetical protein
MGWRAGQKSLPPSSRRGVFSLDSPLYRTGGTIVLTNKWEEVTDKKDLQHYQKCFADRDRATAEKASAQEQSEPSSKNF